MIKLGYYKRINTWNHDAIYFNNLGNNDGIICIPIDSVVKVICKENREYTYTVGYKGETYSISDVYWDDTFYWEYLGTINPNTDSDEEII